MSSAKNLRITIKLLLVIGMACFFFPFVTVSCSEETIVEATGFELAASISTHEGNEYVDFDEDGTPNPYLLAGFFCGLVSLIIIWKSNGQRRNKLLAGCFAAVGGIFIFLFRITFWNFYELTGYENRVTVEFRWGWVITLLSYLGAAVSSLMYYQKFSEDEAPTETVSPSQSDEPCSPEENDFL